MIGLAENEGVPARNRALPLAGGKYFVFLDDDSYPLGDAIPRAITYLNRHLKTAALVARVLLPNGQVLYGEGDAGVWVITPGGTPNASWAPTITAVVGNGPYTLTGTQLTGLDEGAMYGDDVEPILAVLLGA